MTDRPTVSETRFAQPVYIERAQTAKDAKNGEYWKIFIYAPSVEDAMNQMDEFDRRRAERLKAAMELSERSALAGV
jgi:hypothetical protein